MLETSKKDQTKLTRNKDTTVMSERKTLSTADPQHEMKGSISPLMQSTKEGLKDVETKEEAD
ncbi:MAG: hypothetical protein ACKVOM_05235 [Ferruginibacter sp.]